MHTLQFISNQNNLPGVPFKRKVPSSVTSRRKLTFGVSQFLVVARLQQAVKPDCFSASLCHTCFFLSVSALFSFFASPFLYPPVILPLSPSLPWFLIPPSPSSPLPLFYSLSSRLILMRDFGERENDRSVFSMVLLWLEAL